MRQALAGVGLEIDQAVAHAVGLVEPDAILVVHADVPEIHRPARIVGQGQPDALLRRHRSRDAHAPLSTLLGPMPASLVRSNKLRRPQGVFPA